LISDSRVKINNPKLQNIIHHDAIADEIYDETVGLAWDKAYAGVTIDLWASELKIMGQIKILEFGCGTGESAIALAKDGNQVIALDISKGMLEKSRRKAIASYLDNILYVQADAEFLPFRDNVFDVLTCSWVLHHVPDVRKTVEEACRVLSPNGRIYIAEVNSKVGRIERIFKLSLTGIFEVFHLLTRRRFDKLKVYDSIAPTWERAIDANMIITCLRSLDILYEIAYIPHIPVLYYYLNTNTSQKLVNLSRNIAHAIGLKKGTVVVISGKKL